MFKASKMCYILTQLAKTKFLTYVKLVLIILIFA